MQLSLVNQICQENARKYFGNGTDLVNCFSVRLCSGTLNGFSIGKYLSVTLLDDADHQADRELVLYPRFSKKIDSCLVGKPLGHGGIS